MSLKTNKFKTLITSKINKSYKVSNIQVVHKYCRMCLVNNTYNNS